MTSPTTRRGRFRVRSNDEACCSSNFFTRGDRDQWQCCWRSADDSDVQRTTYSGTTNKLQLTNNKRRFILVINSSANKRLICIELSLSKCILVATNTDQYHIQQHMVLILILRISWYQEWEWQTMDQEVLPLLDLACGTMCCRIFVHHPPSVVIFKADCKTTLFHLAYNASTDTFVTMWPSE